MFSVRIQANSADLTPTGRPAEARHAALDPAAPVRADAHGISASPRVQRQARAIEQLFGYQPAPVLQRHIHHHTDEAGWKIVELGTAGTRKPGTPPEGKPFFNDLTGAYGATLDNVRAGLADRLMHVGSLPDLDKDLALQWTPLAERLGSYTEQALGKVKTTEVGNDDGDRMINVGSLYMVDLDQPELDETKARSHMPMEDIQACATFVRGLMRANGQLDHIRRSPWWKAGGLRVRVDMNYYHNRPLDKNSRNIGMHKDTAGDNLFVNLVFANTAPTPATEWTQDRAAIAGKKLAAMKKKGVTDGMLNEFQDAKTLLSGVPAPGRQHIEGGVMPSFAFVSWVDELVWHATPSLHNRLKLKKSQLSGIADWFNDPGQITATKGGPDTFMDVLGLLHGQRPELLEGTGFLELHYVDSGSDVQDWYEHAVNPEARSGLRQGWLDVLEAEQAKRAGLLGNTLAKEEEDFIEDDNSSSSSTDVEQKQQGAEPELYQTTDISGRSRSNSDAKTQQEVKDAAEAQGLRSFIRTWVRIEPIG